MHFGITLIRSVNDDEDFDGTLDKQAKGWSLGPEVADDLVVSQTVCEAQ